jgi:hypothetical protein
VYVPRDLSPTEKIHNTNPEKFGSGNSANTQGDFLFKSLLLKNTRFNREKTGQYRSVGKCAKTGQPAACPGSRRPPDDRCGLKIRGFHQRPEKNVFFLKTREIPAQIPPVRHRRASEIQDPPR